MANIPVPSNPIFTRSGDSVFENITIWGNTNLNTLNVYGEVLFYENATFKKDIIIGGNQYRAKPQTGIYAASHGTVYQNINNGRFKALKSKESGIFIKGEIRDIKKIEIGDIEHILVSTSNGNLKCYAL